MSFGACSTVLILAIFTSGKNISRLSQLLQATLSFKYFPFLLNNGKHIPFYCWTSRVLSLCQDQNFDRTSSFCRGPLWFRRFLGLICKVENTQTENKKSNIGSSEEGPTTQKRSQPVTESAHISPSWGIKAPYDKYSIILKRCVPFLVYNLHSASTAPPLEKFVDTFRHHGIITKCYQMHHIHMVLKIHIIKSYFVQGEFLLWPLLKLPGIRKFFYGMWFNHI